MFLHKTLCKKVLMTTIADLFVRLKPFIFILLISKTLGVFYYGIWSQIMVTIGMLLPITMLNLEYGIFRFLPGKSEKETREDFFSIVFFVAIVSFFMILFIILVSKLLSSKFFNIPQLWPLVVIGSIFLFTTTMRELFTSFFIAKEKIIFYSFLVIFDALMTLALSWTIIRCGFGIEALLWVLIVLNVITIVVSSIVVFRMIGFAFPHFINIKKYTIYSVSFLPMIWLLWIVNSSDRYFIGFFNGVKEVGIYSVCYGISYFVINMFSAPFYFIFQPAINRLWNRHDFKLSLDLLNELIKYSLFFILPAAFGFLVLAKSIIPTFTRIDFIAGISVVPFVLLAYTFYILTMFMEIIIYLQGLVKKLLLIYLCTAFSNIIFNFALIPSLGILGAGISTALSFFLKLILTLYWFKSILKIKFGFLVKIIVASMIMVIVIKNIPQQTFLSIIIIIGLGLVVYIAITLLLKIFKRTDLEVIKTVW